MPPGHCLRAHKMLWTVEIYISQTVPFTKEKMPWCPCPFKNEAYRPALCVIPGLHRLKILSDVVLSRILHTINGNCLKPGSSTSSSQ